MYARPDSMRGDNVKISGGFNGQSENDTFSAGSSEEVMEALMLSAAGSTIIRLSERSYITCQ
jgi:hypothetical protein